MELYLDSANLKEIEEGFKLGFLAGLTTTPTFMHRDGITDIDGMILKLSKMVPVLQVEALGHSAEEILDEAERLLALGLDIKKTVFKIPISLEGARACKMLKDKGMMVNLHLVYTVQQAYIALSAGADYVCPLVGRLQDQGHDALGVIEQCVNAVNKYGYNSKIMFSSVRYPEHVRNGLKLGVHTITVPWGVLQQLTKNNFTEIGTQQFFEHTKLMTVKVREVISNNSGTILANKSVMDALVEMTRTKFGAVTIVDDNNAVKGVFTDGDLRRMLESEGEAVLGKTLGSLPFGKSPITIDANELLFESSKIFKEHKVDTIVVTDGGRPIGILDIQDLI
ncbi:transaldolase family protein [Flexithrix dorotheae]|uniref:transaldolase family protein n=1 Tax=Flexithrix dorotheae TaxID=70993 RepID=UPI000377FFFC|nr:transaldolase family protein [Flexithrix dorotheae]